MTKTYSPNVTVAVITRNRANSLRRTLTAISNLQYENFEVVVVDNASTDDTKMVIEEFGFRYLYSPESFGFAKTRQLAVESALGEFIIWCDDDCVPSTDWISQYVNMFSVDSSLALIGGKVINVGFSDNLAFKGKSIHYKNGKCKFVEDADAASFFGNLNLAMRVSSVKRVGGYDPYFRGGYEEIDLNLVLRRFSFCVAYCEHAVVFHYHNVVSFKKGRLFHGANFMRLYLYFKHYNVLKDGLFIFNELQLFASEFVLYSRGLISGIKRLNYVKSSIFLIEISNLFLSKLFIPVIFINSFFKNRNLEATRK